jgi:hypothetical protein
MEVATTLTVKIKDVKQAPAGDFDSLTFARTARLPHASELKFISLTYSSLRTAC